MSSPLLVSLGLGDVMLEQLIKRIVKKRLRTGLDRLAKDTSGTTAAEFALVILIFVSIILGSIDFSRQAWEINLAKTAVREGARLAAVRPIVSTYLQNLDPIAAGFVAGNGDPIPAGSVDTKTCRGATRTCEGGSSSTAMNDVVFDEIVTRMQRYNPRIQRANVVIIYRHVGLGFAGNPFGPDVEPEISVYLTGMTVSRGALSLFGVRTLSMPSLISTISSEDLS
jgi:hypothetical protein